MTDLALLDQIMDIVHRVPGAHNQRDYIAPNHKKEAAEAELAANPDLAAVVDCNTALCVAGRALHLKGYRSYGSYGFSYPDDHPRRGRPVSSIGKEAAEVLDLSREESGNYGPGLFTASNTLEDLEDWVAHLHGELARNEVLRRIERRHRTPS